MAECHSPSSCCFSTVHLVVKAYNAPQIVVGTLITSTLSHGSGSWHWNQSCHFHSETPLFRARPRFAVDGIVLWVCDVLWWINTSNSCVCLPLLRDVIKRIDQSEFEGFEYINPLLLSTEESVWRRDQLPPSPTYCLSKLPSQPKTTRKPIERRGGRGGGGGVEDNREDKLTLWTCQQGKANRRMGEFPSWMIQIVLLGYQTLLSCYLQGKQGHRTSRTFPVVTLSSPFLFPPSASFLFPPQNVHPRVKARAAL